MSRVVLLGAGEAHLFVLDAIRRGRLKGADVTFVAPEGSEPWPPMVAGIVAGRYRAEEATPDMARLAGAAGVRRMPALPDSIDAASRTLRIPGAGPIEWDVLSVALPPEPDAGPGAFLPARPGSRAIEIPARLEALAREGQGLSVVIVGAGLRGLEMACAIRARLDRMERTDDRVTIVERQGQLLPAFSEAAARAAERAIVRRRIGIATGTTVTGADGQGIRFGHGGSARADLVVWAGDAVAAPILGGSGLETDERGMIITGPGLRSVSHPSVFASGGSGRIREGNGADRRTRPARRDAMALLKGLASALRGDFSSTHRPTRPVATFLDTGDGRALVFGKSLAVHSTAALFLKERRDRELMQRLRA
ncbi:MAG TPA: FAD-dependent oxidoreductase [Gemmatimonadales bacterium]